MDQKRLLAAIAISIGILLSFDLLNRPAREAQRAELAAQQQAAPVQHAAAPPAPPPGPVAPRGAQPGAAPAAGEPRAPGARLPVDGPRLHGSISLRGAR